MRPWSLILLVVCASCGVRVPQPHGMRISVKASVRVPTQVHVHTQGQVHAHGQVQTQGQVQGQGQVQVPVVEVRAEPYVPPPPPPPAVAIENAPVVEFFGVPLEGVEDVVFVLDCSGSMDELARGRAAQIDTTIDPNAAADPNQANQPPPDPNQAPSQPPPDPNQAPNQPPPDPNQPPPDPNAAPQQPAPPEPRRPRKIEVAQAELADALARLPAGTRMNVLFFNSELEAFAPSLVPLQESARGGLITFVKQTVPDGKTALAPALRTAFLMNARRVVLLSDGLGNVGGNADAVLRDAREAMRGGVRIDTIGLGDDADQWLLSTLAKESGGLYQGL